MKYEGIFKTSEEAQKTKTFLEKRGFFVAIFGKLTRRVKKENNRYYKVVGEKEEK